jgi:hypothetical protein
MVKLGYEQKKFFCEYPELLGMTKKKGEVISAYEKCGETEIRIERLEKKVRLIQQNRVITTKQ